MDSTKDLINLYLHSKSIEDLIKEEHNKVMSEKPCPIIYCPNCYSTNIQTLTEIQQLAAHNYKYLCLTCRSRFNDDTKTPFDFKMPPIETWLQCWFLFCCSNPIEYIAAKLNLDMDVVKQMLQELQKIFTLQSINPNMNYETWYSSNSQSYTKRIQEEFLKRRKERAEKKAKQKIATKDRSENLSKKTPPPTPPKNKSG